MTTGPAAQRAGLRLDEIKVLLSASPGDPAAIGRLREVADRKLPEITALIERSQLVRSWLECAAGRECPDLDQCPLFDDPALPLRHDAAPAEPKAKLALTVGRDRGRPVTAPGLRACTYRSRAEGPVTRLQKGGYRASGR